MGMTDSRSARSTPILSAPTNPAHPAQPEAPESRVPHHSEGHRADLKVGLRVGYNKWAVPARAKRDIAYRQRTAHCGLNRANQPFTALLQQAYHGVGSTASHRHQNHVRSGQKRSPVQGPRRSVGGRGEISLNGVTSNCPRCTSSQAPRGRQPAREWAEQEPPLDHFAVLAMYPHPQRRSWNK